MRYFLISLRTCAVLDVSWFGHSIFLGGSWFLASVQALCTPDFLQTVGWSESTEGLVFVWQLFVVSAAE